MRWFPALLFSAALSFAPSIAAQSLQDTQFQLVYSPSGITSLKHVHDKYDTDYIADGRTVGDVLVRYRAVGEKDWRKASAAVLNTSASPYPQGVSFTIGQVVPTLASLARPSASARGPVFALNDQLLPRNSHDVAVPRFIWFGKKGTTEWVQYDFPEPKEIRSVEVYWAVHEDDNSPGKVPKSWRVLYREGEDWKEVNTPSGYPVAADQINQAALLLSRPPRYVSKFNYGKERLRVFSNGVSMVKAGRFLQFAIFRLKKISNLKTMLWCGPFP